MDYPQEVLEFATLAHGYEFYRSKGVTFEEGCDDLDYYAAAFLRLPSGSRLGLMARPRHPTHNTRVGAIAHANDPNPIKTLDEFLRYIGESREIVEWLSPYLTGERRWVLIMEDLLGKQFVAGHFWSQGTVEAALQIYEKKRPKVKYWVELRDPIPDWGQSG